MSPPPLQIVTRTTPVKRGLLHDPRVPEDCPADVGILIADCTKLIAADRPDTKVRIAIAQYCAFHHCSSFVSRKHAHAYPLHGALCVIKKTSRMTRHLLLTAAGV
jgi:hypothetical protein